MRTRVIVHVAKDHWVLEVLAPVAGAGLAGLRSRAEAFLLGKSGASESVLHRVVVPVERTSDADWKSLFQQHLIALSQRLALPLNQCALDIRLGPGDAQVGYFKVRTARDTKATPMEVTAFARAWVLQSWALDYSRQVTRLERFGTGGSYLITCVDQAIPQGISDACDALGMRMNSITPAFIHTLEAWMHQQTKANALPIQAPAAIGNSIVALLEQGVEHAHAQIVQFAAWENSTLIALCRVWQDASTVAQLRDGDAALVATTARRLLAPFASTTSCHLYSSAWPNLDHKGMDVPPKQVSA